MSLSDAGWHGGGMTSNGLAARLPAEPASSHVRIVIGVSSGFTLPDGPDRVPYAPVIPFRSSGRSTDIGRTA